MRIKSTITKLLSFTFVCIVALMLYLIFNRKPKHYSLENDKEINLTVVEKIPGSTDHDIQYLKYKVPPGLVRQMNQMKQKIQKINEDQHILNNKQFRGLNFDYTVFVIRVHPNISYLSLFFDSVRRIQGVRKSFLIFAHDYYDEEINEAITRLKFVRILQIFYPYGMQLHPYVYPGADGRFCEKIGQCVHSEKRDPVLSQSKLFWWWVNNQVFDHIEVLKNYHGYIYFFETDKYLTRDVIVMVKLLEHIQPKFCPKCRILSLGSYYPRVQLYRPLSVNFILSVWGWSNYSNSGFGFNRSTWEKFKSLKVRFCYFRDPSWENSMKHLASKTVERHLYMLFLEAPRFFPLYGCGAFRNGTNCDLDTVYRDIVKFVASIRYWVGTHTFSLKLDKSFIENEVEPRGKWGDARDKDFCMFFSSGGRRLYY